MIELSASECRVLGVLVEKAQTTPEQYPLSLNALTNGSNQKNNRDPVLALSEDDVFEAVEALRRKMLVVRVDTVGSRVAKYRHNASDVLKVRTGELVLLAELFLRGPSTLGELRGRASRMHPLDSLDVVKDLLRALTERPEPLVRQLLPEPGSRAERFMHLLGPTPLDSRDEPTAVLQTDGDGAASSHTVQAMESALQRRVTALETEVAELRAAVQKLSVAFGEPDSVEKSSKSERNSSASTL